MNRYGLVVMAAYMGWQALHGADGYAQDGVGTLDKAPSGDKSTQAIPSAESTPLSSEPAKIEEISKVDEVLNSMQSPQVQDLGKVPGPPQTPEQTIRPGEAAAQQRTIKEEVKVPPLDYVKIPLKKHGMIKRQQWHYIGPIEHINGQFVVELTSRGDVSLAVGTNALVEPFVEIRDPVCVDGNLETQIRRCVINQPGVYYIGLLGISSQNEYTVEVSGHA